MTEAPKVMWTIGQIAERDGISKQGVSKIVRKLVESHDLPIERDGRDRIKAVSLAHYDHHRGRFVNPAKVKTTEPEKGKSAADSFEEARRQNEWLKVERTRLEQALATGKLLRRDRFEEALEKVGLAIRGRIDRLPNRADDLAHAAMKEGVSGLRLKLREVAFEILSGVSLDLDEIAAKAAKQDPALPEIGNAEADA